MFFFFCAWGRKRTSSLNFARDSLRTHGSQQLSSTGDQRVLPTPLLFDSSEHKIELLQKEFYFVPGVGIEPTRPYGQRILSPLWLPVTAPGQISFSTIVLEFKISFLVSPRGIEPRSQPSQGCVLSVELWGLSFASIHIEASDERECRVRHYLPFRSSATSERRRELWGHIPFFPTPTKSYLKNHNPARRMRIILR